MPPSPFSPELLPSTLATVVAFAPPAAAGWARRAFFQEPAGQTATCWLVMALVGATSFVGYFYHWVPRSFPTSVLVVGLMPLLLIPPSLAWIGDRARRWQGALLAAWAAVTTALVVALGTGREFRVVGSPLMSAFMGVVSVWALAAQVRRAPASVRQCDWFWILVGHVTYFATSMFRAPLIEALVARHWAAAVDVNIGILLLYCASYVVIARGMVLGAAEAPRVRRAAQWMGAV